MIIQSLSLAHQTAPLSVREQLSLDDADAAQLAHDIVSSTCAYECIVLSTCNRFEVYWASEVADAQEILGHVLKQAKSDQAPIENHMVTRSGSACASHLFRVTASLESVVVGEPQILGQVKSAFRAAQDKGCVGKQLNMLFQSALREAKAVREQSGIAESAVSLSYVGVELARNIFGDLDGRSCILVGAGQMGALAAKHFVEKGSRITLLNRTLHRAEHLAKELGGKAVPYAELESVLQDADIVLTATGAQEPIITKEMMKRVTKKRKYRPIFMVDIAVPRDIEEGISDLEGVYAYDVDDLGAVADKNRESRLQRARTANGMIDEAVKRWSATFVAQDMDQVIRDFRAFFLTQAALEQDRFLDQLDMLDSDKERIRIFINQMMNRVLHEPTTKLRRVHREETLNGSDIAAVVSYLFGHQDVLLDGFFEEQPKLRLLDADETALESADPATAILSPEEHKEKQGS